MSTSLFGSVYLVLGIFILLGNLFRWHITLKSRTIRELAKWFGDRQVRLFLLLVGLVSIVLGLPAGMVPGTVVSAVQGVLLLSIYLAGCRYVLRRRAKV